MDEDRIRLLVIKSIETLQLFPKQKTIIAKSELADIISDYVDKIKDELREELKKQIIESNESSVRATFGTYKIITSRRVEYRVPETSELLQSYGIDISPALEIDNKSLNKLISSNNNKDDIFKKLEKCMLSISVTKQLRYFGGK